MLVLQVHKIIRIQKQKNIIQIIEKNMLVMELIVVVFENKNAFEELTFFMSGKLF